MASITETPFSRFIEALTDTEAQLIEGAAELAHESTNTYAKSLKMITEQQRLVYHAFQLWLSEATSAQTQFRRQLVESYGSARRELINSAEDSVQLAGEAGAEVARASRRSAPARSQPGAPKADGQGPANWGREDYESLTAAEVIARLPQLSQRELEEVETYEKAHQARHTVLQKLASLRGPEPVPGYDELNVPQIQRHLAESGPELATRVRDYERQRKRRDGVLQAADAQLAKA